MDCQNGPIFNEMYRFYSFRGAFAPHHGLLRVKLPKLRSSVAYPKFYLMKSMGMAKRCTSMKMASAYHISNDLQKLHKN